VTGVKVASANSPDREPGRLGLALRPLAPEELQRVGTKGLVVEAASGPAARAGIQPGDLLLAVNGKPIESVEQLRAMVVTSGKTMALLIQREGEKISVPVDLGATQG
jgi:serine protease Do